MDTLVAVQQNAAVFTAAATVLGAIVVFILLYMLLERKKKTLIFLCLLALAGYGIFYWHTSDPNIVTPTTPECKCAAAPEKRERVPLPPQRPRPQIKRVVPQKASPPPPVQPKRLKGN